MLSKHHLQVYQNKIGKKNGWSILKIIVLFFKYVKYNFLNWDAPCQRMTISRKVPHLNPVNYLRKLTDGGRKNIIVSHP